MEREKIKKRRVGFGLDREVLGDVVGFGYCTLCDVGYLAELGRFSLATWCFSAAHITQYMETPLNEVNDNSGTP